MSEIKENIMRTPKIEKVILSAGANGDALDKAVKLLEIISKRKVIKTKGRKRIPTWGVRPGLEIGCKVTLRGKEAIEMLKRALVAVDKEIKKKQIAPNHFSFGVPEYIEMPGVEYQRDIGIIGFNVTVDFIRKGVRVKRRKMKEGKLPGKQAVTTEEIIKYLEENFGVIIK
ncbi:50S ribosomal protein L5 [Candidatus Pacearchaeota archaeon CG10_big_fil_rev_8_21_14_0_10_35_13]|nr:MAG: 50S ribosomal protein L5 [Candidatus Pacearchaeota archaeon CG10_big_fil_rev_8_21_14_0_10_35_13]